MSNLYIDTVMVVGGILTPIAIILIIVLLIRAFAAVEAQLQNRTEELKRKPGFQVKLHKVPNPTMWGVEISKNGEVLQDVGVDKL